MMTMGEARDHDRWMEFISHLKIKAMLIGNTDNFGVGATSYTIKDAAGVRRDVDTMDVVTEFEWEERYDKSYGAVKFLEWLEVNPVTSEGNGDGEETPE